MKKYRLSTTISPKHWSLLKKYTGQFETQQKALEHALEYLDNSSPEMQTLSDEDKTWVRIGREMRTALVLFPKDYFKVMQENIDLDDFQKYVNMRGPTELAIEFYYKKPLKACSLQEVIDCILLNIRIQNSADSAVCKDAGDYYEIYITHTLAGLKHSRMLVMMNEHALNAYGAKFESSFTERYVFFKIYKNNGQLNNGGGRA